MNNKDFIKTIAARLDTSEKEAEQLVSAFANTLASTMEEGDQLAVQQFGTFEIKKKLERVVVNPATKQRMLVPPKLALAFKASNTLKEKAQQP